MKRLKDILVAALTTSAILFGSGQVVAQPFGNEWINFNQTYFKIKVGTNGVYRIPYSQLQANGMGSVTSAQFVLYREGQQVPIYISSNSTLSTNDYIEFYGRTADGNMDSELYDIPSRQSNPNVNIISDTAVYFLSFATGTHSRLQLHNNVMPVPAPAAAQFCRTVVTPAANIRQGFSDGENYWLGADINVMHSGKIDKGEAFAYTGVNNVTLALQLLEMYGTNPNPILTTAFQYNGKVSTGRSLKLTINGNEIHNAPISAYDLVKLEIPFNQSYLAANTNLTYTLSPSGALSVQRAELQYNRTFNFSGVADLQFTVQGNNQNQRISFTGLNNSNSNLLVDITNSMIYHLGNYSEVALNPTSQNRQLFFAANPTFVNQLIPVNFRNYSVAANQGTYILLSDKEFVDIPNGGVQAYASYRRSVAGGNHNVVVVTANELYDQFGYGVEYHPLGIKRFLRFAHATWSNIPEYMFILGRGLSYNKILTYLNNRATYNYPIVPTYGTPGSDNLFGELGTNSVPYLAIGRLSAKADDDIHRYLTKVKEYEIAQQVPLVPNLENTLWKKRGLHIAGSQGSQEQSVFLSYLNFGKGIIEDTLLGAMITTSGKTTSSVIENAAAQIDSLMNEGVQYVSFFGHASASGFDYNLNNPEKYNSTPKYPIFMAYGCDVARIFETVNSRTISENYLYVDKGGAIAMIASTNLGLTGPLGRYLAGLYKKYAVEEYGKTLGKQYIANIAAMQAVSSDVTTSIHSQNILLQGDPGLSIYSPSLPDYYIDETLVSTNPSVVNTTMDSFTINAQVYNLGKAVNEEIYVHLTKTKAGSSTVLFSDSVKIKLLNTDTISFKVPVTANDIGLYHYNIKLNPAQNPDELSFANNNFTLQLYISEDNLKPIFPYDYSIVYEQGVTLKASTLNPFVKPAKFIFEIDTTESFNSPFKQVHTVTSPGGLLKWALPFQMVDSTVYYWRTTKDTMVNGKYQWNNSSFVYLKDGADGWNQSHYYQFKHNKFDLVDLSELNRKFEGVTYEKELTVQSRDFAFGGENDIMLNDVKLGFGACMVQNGIMFLLIDPLLGHSPSLPPGNFPGGFGSCDAGRARQLEFQLNTPLQRQQAMNFIDSIKDNYYVVVKSTLWSNVSAISFVDDWKADDPGGTNTLYHKLLNLGFDFDPYTSRQPFAGVAQKGNPDFNTQLIFGATPDNLVTLEVPLPFKVLSGTLTTPAIGPAASWTQLLNDIRIENSDDGEDKYAVTVYGLTNADQVDGDSLFTTTSLDTSIAGINASQYPYLKLKWYVEDSTKLSLPQLKYWRILYTPMPEAALSPNLHFVFNDSLEQGQDIKLQFAIENVREIPMDSMLVRVRLIDANNVSRIIAEQKYKPLAAYDTLIAAIDPVSSAAYPGQNMIFVEANPDNDQPEYYHPNNLGYIPFFVKADKFAPIMDVTFDGVHILNRDIVSAKPFINILVRDENRNYLLTDTAGVAVQLYNETTGTEQNIPFDGTICKFVPATSGAQNEARVEFRPELEDGIYTLKVASKDRVGNASGGNVPHKYEISFEVINKSSITHVLNYPNPFSTSTQFIFTLTGSEIPSQFKIQIISVTGKVVREITKAELGPLHIGRNITEYRWDGKDQYGQLLGNGVYLYRVITSNSQGEKIEHRRNVAVDKFFKNDYGKLYIMR
jgi:hypothetical protein